MKKLLILLALLVSFVSFGQTAEELLQSGIDKAEEKDYKGAISDLTKAIELDPNYERAFLARGIIKSQMVPNDISGAINDISKAIDINPNSSSHYKDRALMKAESGNTTGAIDDLTKAIEINPNYPNAYISRGKLKQKLTDHSNAVVDFQRFIDLVPNYDRAYFFMAKSFMALNDNTQAISSYEKAFNINPIPSSAPYYAYTIGVLKAELNDLIGAISWYSKSIDAAYNNGDDRFNEIVLNSFKYRGVCQEKIGNLNAACEDWKKAAELGDTDTAEWVANQCN
jgi:tetratricopeptide (TPR) repeat protein